MIDKQRYKKQRDNDIVRSFDRQKDRTQVNSKIYREKKFQLFRNYNDNLIYYVID